MSRYIYGIDGHGCPSNLKAFPGIIPEDCWTEPYMSKDQLRHEIAEGVAFWGYEDKGKLVGVMGFQPVQDVTLIRHAYVATSSQEELERVCCFICVN